MNTPSVSAIPVTASETRTLDEQIGVCYHCRKTVWDGTGLRWHAPHACPYCQQPLTLVLQAQHRNRTNITD